MPWVKLAMTEEHNRARGFLTGDGYPVDTTEIRVWLTPDDTLVVELYWHVYQPGEGGEHRGETVLHKDAEGHWQGWLGELLGCWFVRSKFAGKYGLLLFADNEAQIALVGTGKMICGALGG